MFTGIIQDVGEVIARQGARLTFATHLPGLKVGDSVACAGCCLTLIDVIDPPLTPSLQGRKSTAFTVEVSPETLACTIIDTWERGTKVNLEPALRAGDVLGGHIVTGHIDGLAQLLTKEKKGDFYHLTFKAPSALELLIATKGSVALDGISLTVNAVKGPHFGVMIIPHTWHNTTLCFLSLGDYVHIEADILARYAARAMEVLRT